MNRKILNFLLFFSFTLFIIVGCQPQKGGETTDYEGMEEETMETEDTQMEMQETTAVAQMGPASGSEVTGTVTFTKNNGEVSVVVDLQNVPEGKHAIHIHENGDCSAEDATSAGGHWNPAEQDHGHISHTDQFHYGDIGNLEAGADGHVHFERTVDDIWTIGDGSDSDIVGKGVIVHAGEDDFTTQPTGGAGARISCGVIQEQ